MYKEVAFDPSCMADIEYYNLVKQHFGFDKGRYISAEKKSWAREAMDHVKKSELKPLRKKSVTNYLNSLGKEKKNKEFLLTRDRQNVRASCWQEWYEKQKKIRQFSCTVADADCEDRINIDRINNGCEQWNVPPSVSVERNPISIIAELYPLLSLSERLTLVDQYFRFSENKVFVELFDAIRTTSVNRIRVATSMETPNIQGVYDRQYRALNHSNIHLQWIEAPDKYFHDRYVITDVGAVRSGQGFMEGVEKGIHSDLANINIIGRDEAKRTLNELDQLIKDGRANIRLCL